MPGAVGIDLGTTNSCVAVFQNDSVRIIQNEDGDRVTPSYVTFTEECVYTGKEAIDISHKYLDSTIYEVKRLIGQSYDNAKVQNDINKFRYCVIDRLNRPNIVINYENKESQEYYPEEISAFVLQRLKRIAEDALKANVDRAVVTVPAYFSDIQRQATKNAAYIAGFKTVNVINEPTAAALAFNHECFKGQTRNILVYDFGGGTFDVSIVTIDGKSCRVKGTKGDCHLGGTDIDNELADYLKKDILEKLDVIVNDTDFYRVKSKCEKAKKSLSGKSYSSLVEIDALGKEKKTYSNNISRAKLEQLSKKIFNKTMEIVDDCLNASKLTVEEIDEVVLVGGSSRIPKVQTLLGEKFGNEKINKQLNPDEAVAFGAALYANDLVEGRLSVFDVTSLSLGTNVIGDSMSVIIPKNTAIPTKRFKTYKTISDNQNSMEFPIYQGESEVASENYKLGHLSITDITASVAGNVKVRVCFAIDEDGLINIFAKETNSLKTKQATIDIQKCGLTSEQIKERIKQTKINNQMVKEQEEFLDVKYELEMLLLHAMGIANDYLNRRKYKSYLERLNETTIESLETLLDIKVETQQFIQNNEV